MRIGIYTWWRKQGVSYIAAQLAEKYLKLGNKISIFYPVIDKDVHPKESEWLAPPGLSYGEWLSKFCPHLVVFVYHFPYLEAYETKNKNIRMHYVPFWERTKEYRSSMDICDAILTPTRSCNGIFRIKSLRDRVINLDWGLDIPISNPKPKKTTTTLLYIQGYPESRRRGDFAIGAMNHLMDNPNTLAEIIYVDHINRRDLPGYEYFLKSRDGRVTVYDHLSREDILRRIENADLLLWPTCREGLGLIGLESIYKGTPVLGFSVPPLHEFLNNENSELSVQTLGKSFEGITEVVNPNYAEYLKSAERIFPRLSRMNVPTLASAKRRNEGFRMNWEHYVRRYL